MNILVLNDYCENKVISVEHIPRIGERVDMFCEPLPRVKDIINYPRKERLEILKAEKLNIAAIVVVG